MGYRSDIGLVLTQSAVQRMHKKLNTLNKNSEAFSAITDFIAYADKYHEDADTKAKVYLWNYVKWYDDFKEVNFLEELMQELNEQDYLFIRIGEDYDDTEVRGDFWDNPFALELNRGISIISACDNNGEC